MKRIIVALLLTALAGQASAAVGSIISSFFMYKTSVPASIGTGIYRDPRYVYAFIQHYDILYIQVYTPSGNFVSQLGGWYIPQGIPGDMTGCHLGSSYAALSIFNRREIWITNDWYNILQSFPVQRPGGGQPGDIMWDGRYYHVHNYEGRYNLYTPAGALAGQWTVAGWPAGMRAYGSTFSKCFNNAGGRYLFVGGTGRLYAFNMDDGSLLTSWGTAPVSCYTIDYGDAYPTSYGGALWGNVVPINRDHWAYQIDVDARGATNVLPASVGKIKAIYR